MEVVILAAGKGTRMYSAHPKVLHTIGGKPMLQRVIDTAKNVEASHIHVVIGFGADQIKAHFENADSGVDVNWLLQEQQLGTGHAVQQAVNAIDSDDNSNIILVLYGDVPLIQALGVPTIHACDVMSTTSVVRHDPEKLAQALLDVLSTLWKCDEHVPC